MILQNQSFSSSKNGISGYHSKINVNSFKQQMKKIRQPFQNNINKSKQSFNQKIKLFQENLFNKDKDQEENYESQKVVVVNTYKQQKMQTQQDVKQRYDSEMQQNGKKKLKDSSQLNSERKQRQNEKNHKKINTSNIMKQWKPDFKHSFFNIEEVKQNYVNVFNKKLSVKKKNVNKNCYDFKEDQKIMLKNIFHQISDHFGPNKGFAKIDKILQFFQENQLFYLFYNLQKKSLKHVLKEFAHTKGDSLNQLEFLHLLFMDRPLVKDLSDPQQKIVHRKCILDQQGWQQLKKIFNTLDTFGNQTIHFRPFIKKLKSYTINRNFIHTPVIQFPQIQRVYTLKKVIFDLEYKFQLTDKVIWKDIQDLIINFNHKQQPSLDVIFQNHLQQATILLDSNYFFIQKTPISILKNIFEKCPKYSDFFVNTKFICNEILESHQLKSYLKNPIRQKQRNQRGYMNLQQATRYMAVKAPDYVDLDEFLQYFSIKGPVTNIMPEEPNFDLYQSDQQSSLIHGKQVKQLKKIRSLQKLQKFKYKKAKKPIRQITDFQQFNLTKKQKQTIRQKRLQQMLLQKQLQQENQLKKKFKANPIPAQLNPQRLKMQQKRMQMQKRKKLQQIYRQKQEDKQLINYLKANTRLFQPLNKQNLHESNQNQIHSPDAKKKTKFVHKPVPWFVHQKMLQKIQQEKSQRKKKIYEQAKIKYIRSWNKLPDFYFHEQQQENSAQNSILQELKGNNQYQIHRKPIKASPVPDFKSLHKQFQQTLQKKKKEFTPTKIIQFKLTSPKIQKKHLHSEYFSPQNRIRTNDRWRQTLHSPPTNKIFTTKKTEDWTMHNKKLAQSRREKVLIEKQKEKERIQKQKNFAKFMSQKLKQQQKSMPNLQYQTAEKLKKYKKRVKYLQRQTSKQLAQIYNRVLQRPFLFEQAVARASNHTSKLNKKTNKKNKIKKVKHIQPIDMSDNQYKHNKQDNSSKNEQYSQQSPHQELNQSF